jgi:hypothetical protein
MRAVWRRVRALWPVPVAAAAVLGLLNSDAVPVVCRGGGPFDRPILSTCEPSLFWQVTGPNPALVALSWVLVGLLIAIGLSGWTRSAQGQAHPGGMTHGLRRVVLLGLPLLPAAGAVAYLLSGDGITHYCPSQADPLVGSACLPTLAHGLTGSDPIVIGLSWLLVGALIYVGLLGWSLTCLAGGPRSRAERRMSIGPHASTSA